MWKTQHGRKLEPVTPGLEYIRVSDIIVLIEGFYSRKYGITVPCNFFNFMPTKDLAPFLYTYPPKTLF